MNQNKDLQWLQYKKHLIKSLGKDFIFIIDNIYFPLKEHKGLPKNSITNCAIRYANRNYKFYETGYWGA